MNAHLTIVAAALGGVLLGLPAAFGFELEPTSRVSIAFSNDSNELVVYPREIKLEAGQVYRFVVINPSERNHTVAAPELVANSMTADLKTPTGNELSTQRLASGILLRPGQMIEWILMPIKEGLYKFGCNDAGHASAGMHTMVDVAL